MSAAKHMADLSRVVIDPEATLSEVLARLDEAGTGALAVCSGEGKLVGLVSDGDIRRAILRGVALTEPCGAISTVSPTIGREPISDGEALFLMTQRDINHLPVVDERGVLIRFVLRKDLVGDEVLRESTQIRLEKVTISPHISIAEAITRLDEAGTGALALCTEGRLVGVLTDGDIRRAVLRGAHREDPCEGIAVANPITGHDSISLAEALQLMTERDINHLPVVDEEGRLVDFLLRRDLAHESQAGLSAVVMAGGFGRRLLPLTERLPKPMLPVGGRPLLERTIEQLRRAGIRDVCLTTHYLSDSIRGHFGDGRGFGVRISYSNEDQPLGTAGGLRLIKRPKRPFLVMNGDVLTDVSIEQMLSYHRVYHAVMTVGVRQYDVAIPFGVVECDDVRITRVTEKPRLALFVNAGIYLLDPVAYDHIPGGVHYHMTDLINRLLEEGQTVVSFPIVEHWQDVGRPEDYRRAQEDQSILKPRLGDPTRS
jgi:CBS domain-containing protein/dTDP-glucose pyrophosphorylase